MLKSRRAESRNVSSVLRNFRFNQGDEHYSSLPREVGFCTNNDRMSRPLIVIRDPDNVIFTEIFAQLDLNQFERLF